MTIKCQGTKSEEENHPLLLIVDDDLNNRGLFFDRRSERINAGASAIFTDFPNFLSTCWAAILIIGLTFFLTSLIIICSLSTREHVRMPRCTVNKVTLRANETVHLVHGPKEWTRSELKTLEKIINSYQKYVIHLTLIHGYLDVDRFPFQITTNDEPVEYKVTTHEDIIGFRRIKRYISWFKRKSHVNKKPRSLNDTVDENTTTTISTTVLPLLTAATKNDIKNLDYFIKTFPNIIVQNTTYRQYFDSTPLRFTWTRLSDDLKAFGVRVLELWQHGGISFDLNEHVLENKRNAINKKIQTSIDEDLKDIFNATHKHSSVDAKVYEIAEAFRYYNKSNVSEINENDIKKLKQLNELTMFEVVNEVIPIFQKNAVEKVILDLDGVYMGSKETCHVFFGEILTYLRSITTRATVKDLIKRTILLLCKKNHGDNKLCNSIIL